jgi:cytoskeletal protein CcmA (bactofilin family)
MFGRSNKHATPKKTNKATNSPTRVAPKGLTPSVISADMHILGNIISDGFLDIDGKIEGNVKCRSATVRPNGLVRGDIQTDVIHVYGRVEGQIKSRNVSLYSSARVTGTIMHESLSIEDGAFVDGKFKRTDKIFIEDEGAGEQALLESDHLSDAAPLQIPSFSTDTDMDDDEDASEEELRMLENLRLIS